ncbi:hypothetical protein H0H81_006461 [Sphagnurus paluster]|uniref:Uncharacterized protein n=1 Tax=Sphagnurus paluster TaxID=117069 RepID=A0A9P7KJI6_9AGAR|nr:hypothetical protein H0H81_006461 [Sphagnurus paluster]
MSLGHPLRSHVVISSAEIDPALCPICRKPYLPNRSKKLITGEGESDVPIRLLQRLVLSWDTNEDWRERTSEAEGWLRAGNTNPLLLKACDLIRAYEQIKSEQYTNQRSIHQLKRELEAREVEEIRYKENASAIEQSLLSRIAELNTKNPLPRPPEPYPYTYPHNRDSHTTTSQAVVDEHGTLHINGVSGDRKGKGRAAPTPSLRESNVETSFSSPMRPTSVEDATHKNGIIPGAPPNQRFVPTSVFESEASADSWTGHSDSANHIVEEPATIDSYAMVEDYIAEYAGGYVEGFLTSQRQAAPSSSRRTRTSRGAVGLPAPVPPSSDPSTEPRGSSSRPTSHPRSLGAFIRPAQAPADPPSQTRRASRRPRRLGDLISHSSTLPSPPPSAPAQQTSTTTFSTNRPSTMDESWGNHLYTQFPATASIDANRQVHATTQGAPVPTPESSHNTFNAPAIPTPSRPAADRVAALGSRHRPQRRLSDLTDIETTWQPPENPPRPPQDPPPSLRRRSAVIANVPPTASTTFANDAPRRDDVARPSAIHLGGTSDRASLAASMDSWYSITSLPEARNRPFAPAHDVNSVSDLDLRRFEDLALSPSHSLQDGASLVLFQQSGVEPDNLSRTPRSLLSEPPQVPWGFDRPYQEPENARPLPVPSQSSYDTIPPSIPHPSSLRPAHTRRPSATVAAPAVQPQQATTQSPWTFSHNYSTPSRSSSNALGLSVDTTRTSPDRPRISAPTPITSTRQFLRSFSHDGYES